MLTHFIPTSITTRYTFDVEQGTAFDWKRNRFVIRRRSYYTNIRFEGKSYPLHRVLFFIATGMQPEIVAFRDGDPGNLTRWNLVGYHDGQAFAPVLRDKLMNAKRFQSNHF